VGEFQATYGQSPTSLFGEDLETHIAGGFLELVGGSLRLTRRGLLLSNEVLSSAIG
jgi:hypothetical protein